MNATLEPFELWNLCRAAYLRHSNINLTFPEGTDPQRTYQWRYLKCLEGKLHKWRMDEIKTRQFIDVVAAYAKERGLHRKGLAVFMQGNILDVCHQKLLSMKVKESTLVQKLQATADFLAKYPDQINAMLARPQYGSWMNLTDWYRSSKIDETYLAISRSCTTALSRISKIDAAERAVLPDAVHLYRVRASKLRDAAFVLTARNILGDDWRTL